MIAGELETYSRAFTSPEEHFLGREQDRGYEGIGRTIATLTGGRNNTSQPNAWQNQNAQRRVVNTPRSGPPVIVYVLGGLVVISVAIFITLSLSKKAEPA